MITLVIASHIIVLLLFIAAKMEHGSSANDEVPKYCDGGGIAGVSVRLTPHDVHEQVACVGGCFDTSHTSLFHLASTRDAESPPTYRIPAAYRVPAAKRTMSRFQLK
jgi:hypothetical protein